MRMTVFNLIRDDIKSLVNQIKKTDLHDQVAFNELCYGGRAGDRIYAFCPFCREVVEIDAGQTEELDGRIRLQETASCGCRQGLRYIQLGFLERMQPRKKDQAHPFQDVRDEILKRSSRDKKEAVVLPAGEWNISESAPDYGSDDFGYVPDDFGYIPDDFEPGLDPYDRQALYDDQLMDDWVIAHGGNPADYGDWAETFSDPFGFGGDDD